MDFGTIQSAEYADFLMKKGKPEQFDQVPVGTGPFTFVSYQKDAVIRFKANPNYWGGKPADRRSRLRHHPGRDGARLQAEDGRVPGCALSAPGRSARNCRRTRTSTCCPSRG